MGFGLVYEVHARWAPALFYAAAMVSYGLVLYARLGSSLDLCYRLAWAQAMSCAAGSGGLLALSCDAAAKGFQLCYLVHARWAHAQFRDADSGRV